MFQFAFFLWSERGLFLLFSFAFIFLSRVAHVCSSLVENDFYPSIRPRSPPKEKPEGLIGFPRFFLLPQEEILAYTTVAALLLGAPSDSAKDRRAVGGA